MKTEQQPETLAAWNRRAAFAAEYQLTTRIREDAVAISPQLVASRLNGAARLTLPPGTAQAVAFVDVNAAAGLSYTVLAAGPHQCAAVADWGRWPGGGERLVPRNATAGERDRLLRRAMAAEATAREWSDRAARAERELAEADRAIVQLSNERDNLAHKVAQLTPAEGGRA